MTFFERFARFERKSLETGAFIVGGATIVGSFLGILKNSLLASRFGASASLDVYFAAFRVPDLLYNIFIFSTLSGAFFPIFSRVLLRGKDEAWKLLSSLMWLFSLVLGLGAIAVFITSHAFASFLAPGFSTSQLDQLSVLLRILMLQPIGMALANLFANVLQIFKRFFISTLAPVFYNGGIIIGTVWFSQWWGIAGVAWGVVLGSLAYALVQIPTLRNLEFRFSFRFREVYGDIKDMMLLMIPRSMTLVMNQFVLFWITILASLLPVGSLAIYSFADSIQALPQTVIALSFVTVAFPRLADLWVRSERGSRDKEKQAFIRVFDRSAAETCLWLIPLAMLLVVFSEPVVRFLLGYGNFVAQDQNITTLTLIVFAIGIPFQGLLMLLIRTFFAMEDTKHPLFAVLASLGFIIPGTWFLSSRIGAPGLAAGMVIGVVLTTVYLLFLLSKRLGAVSFPKLRYAIQRGLAIGAIGALPGGAAYMLLDFFMQGNGFGVTFVRTSISGAISLAAMGIAVLIYKLIDVSVFADEQNHREEENTAQIN
ncbi:MAG: murein biosynthesis integral membrane protein MurJ [Candidatus Brennerbacteria bacterium CG11_big_fil_rev_8_21_14_0_20_43_10]|uniref:Murein biosynthesis integral membrane protein MurJ n=3 Tax=Candidatus Brenneribacteriota TaxID=1817902 RepID=A0A2M8C0X0_9BACT|nr:MAG: murein biosynthesis integral membrane protein MurJ [Parcubacteria group bacterium CG1_02_44_31]PIP50253.1 MAG: murein biosynthesis integral membrane protein MurJ [Candidatus Brennerbacteria bacterium CG23_combo_of_CG06-09_8_20_14_all_44_41]PIR26472.1 MAG: murein biosynthesis integral membrane protein MurJ [Candidatus Brennerbacteria bacterium CG11_big_fil_rev_8_21_14_0_20_43_10]PIX28505.1 MAG: murein biosynthesis integral membrane protein MurJ [Candidatus Brennerbacteria bacterium CG_4_8